MNQAAINWATMFISFYKHSALKDGFRMPVQLVNDNSDYDAEGRALELKENAREINEVMKRRANLGFAIATGNYIAIFPAGKGKKLPDDYPEWELTREDLDKMGIDEDDGTHT